MMKIRSILTGIAISLSLAGMAQSQYDGAPVNRSANETSTDNVEVRRNKYPVRIMIGRILMCFISIVCLRRLILWDTPLKNWHCRVINHNLLTSNP